jgi:hypothetical protein
MIAVNLTGIVKTAPIGGARGASSTIVPVGTVNIIATGKRVDVYDPVTNTVVAIFTVTVPLSTITDMVFNSPFLTVQGAGPFAVTLDYTTAPPTIKPAVPL